MIHPIFILFITLGVPVVAYVLWIPIGFTCGSGIPCIVPQILLFWFSLFVLISGPLALVFGLHKEDKNKQKSALRVVASVAVITLVFSLLFLFVI